MKNLTIGLLGGSFNPPHEGHLYISNQALRILGCHKIWWIIAQYNPLKKKEEYEDFSIRVKKAKDMITNYKRVIEIVEIEKSLNISYSYNVVLLLKRKFKHINFIWIMGSDNFFNIHYWYRWQDFCKLLPILFLERPNFIYSIFNTKFANCFQSAYFANPRELLINIPSWSFVRMKGYKISSSDLRESFRLCQ